MRAPHVHRRTVLGTTAAGAAVLAVPSTPESFAAAARKRVFAHGIASGDPLPDAVLIWTRVSAIRSKVEVTWEPAWSPEMMTEAARLQLNMV